MHIYFSGIGGSGIGSLAEIAHQIGYQISGSDKQSSSRIDDLRAHGISDIHIGQSESEIAKVHAANPIDWLVYSSAVTFENPDAPELKFAREHGIRVSKRDELLNFILEDKRLDLIAIAGTHGKTTTVAMTVWLFQNLGIPISYLLAAKTNFATMAEFNPDAHFFIYEADEFDRNFLHFSPKISLISGVAYDHQEIFPTLEDYKSAFREFISKSEQVFLWQADAESLNLERSKNIEQIDELKDISAIKLAGKFNRRDAFLVTKMVAKITGEPLEKILKIMSNFPGLSKRMEKIAPNLYSNYAHTPEKIAAAIDVAREMKNPEQDLIVIYEPLTNRRQHYFLDSYKNVFTPAAKLYWLPSYLAREDANLPILTPDELISHLDAAARKIAESSETNDILNKKIARHLQNGDFVVAMVSGGANDGLDFWLRKNFGARN